MGEDTIHPTDMRWLEKGVFGIEWSDGHHGVYPVRHLRLHCPCAACTDEWTGQVILKPDDVPLLIMLKDIEPVGHYAFRLYWSDGHDSGLYSFNALRRLCQCKVCRPATPQEPGRKSSRRLL